MWNVETRNIDDVKIPVPEFFKITGQGSSVIEFTNALPSEKLIAQTYTAEGMPMTVVAGDSRTGSIKVRPTFKTIDYFEARHTYLLGEHEHDMLAKNGDLDIVRRKAREKIIDNAYKIFYDWYIAGQPVLMQRDAYSFSNEAALLSPTQTGVGHLAAASVSSFQDLVDAITEMVAAIEDNQNTANRLVISVNLFRQLSARRQTTSSGTWLEDLIKIFPELLIAPTQAFNSNNKVLMLNNTSSQYRMYIGSLVKEVHNDSQLTADGIRTYINTLNCVLGNNLFTADNVMQERTLTVS